MPKHTQPIMPYLCVKNLKDTLAFYRNVFRAIELTPSKQSQGVPCAEVQINNTRLTLSEEVAEKDFRSPLALGGTTVEFSLNVDDCDRAVNAAAASGGKILALAEDKPYGARAGTIQDPSGHVWHVVSVKEHPILTDVRNRAAASIGRANHRHTEYESGID